MKTLILSILSLMASLTSVTPSFRHSHRRWWSSRSYKPRIIGGEEIKRREFPFLVNIAKFGSHFCGGSLIALDVVLTSAHCVIDDPIDVYTIKAGDHLLRQVEQHERTRQPRAFIIHDAYDKKIRAHDLALIHLKTPFFLSRGYVETVSLVDVGSTPTATAVAMGWGYIRDKGPVSNVPKKLTVTFVERYNCRRPAMSVGDMCYYGVHPNGMCNGDSGGPLMCGKLQCGITSYSWRPCGTDIPDVYTNIAEYRDWIDDEMYKLRP